jgi:hypothetical protein
MLCFSAMHYYNMHRYIAHPNGLFPLPLGAGKDRRRIIIARFQVQKIILIKWIIMLESDYFTLSLML